MDRWRNSYKPNSRTKRKSKLTATVAGTLDKITMIEAGANEIPNDTILEAIKKLMRK